MNVARGQTSVCKEALGCGALSDCMGFTKYFRGKLVRATNTSLAFLTLDRGGVTAPGADIYHKGCAIFSVDTLYAFDGAH